MGLIDCPDCRRQVSDKAWFCPSCGRLWPGGLKRGVKIFAVLALVIFGMALAYRLLLNR